MTVPAPRPDPDRLAARNVGATTRDALPRSHDGDLPWSEITHPPHR